MIPSSQLTPPKLIRGIFALVCTAAVTLACSLSTPAETPPPIIVTTTPIGGGTPLPSPTPVSILATRPPTEIPVIATQCVPRQDWFIYTVTQGDTLPGIALRAETSVAALANANCLSADTPLQAGGGVRVPVALLPPEPPTPNPDCGDQWFFVFRAGESEITNACPSPVITLDVIGQDFEGGRVYRYPTADGALIYVMYNNGFWQAFPDTWDASQPVLDDTLTPPVNRVQPVEGIGKLWRENVQVQTALGWAYAPAAPFTGRIQYPQGRTDYWYIDHGTARLVLRMFASDYAPNPWQIVGEY